MRTVAVRSFCSEICIKKVAPHSGCEKEHTFILTISLRCILSEMRPVTGSSDDPSIKLATLFAKIITDQRSCALKKKKIAEKKFVHFSKSLIRYHHFDANYATRQCNITLLPINITYISLLRSQFSK